MAGGYGGRVARWGVDGAEPGEGDAGPPGEAVPGEAVPGEARASVPASPPSSAVPASASPPSSAVPVPASASPSDAGAPGSAEAVASAASAPMGRWAAGVLAVRERLPMWVQLRCGLEPKTLAALAVVLVAAAVFAGIHFWSAGPEGVEAPDVVGEAAHPPGPVSDPDADMAATGRPEPSPGPAAVPGEGGQIVVDVSGKVRNPGLQRLPSGARVDDALDAAGGARPGTDLAGLNRARVLMDGEQIVVGAPPAPAPASGGPAAAGGGAGPVSLNTATADQLEGLPGVGPVLAQHIVEYRTEHGGFRSVDELREVNGIGDRRFADLRPRVQP